jgi:hypothetical protein
MCFPVIEVYMERIKLREQRLPQYVILFHTEIDKSTFGCSYDTLKTARTNVDFRFKEEEENF